MERIPDAFAATVAAVHGETGRAWLAALPARLEAAARRWEVTLGAPFSLSYNYAAPAERADGTRLVLKAGVPARELLTELAALRAYDGAGAVRLLDADADAGLLLLERAEPGTPLRETLTDAASDDRATRIAAGVMRALWRPLPEGHPFPSTRDWARGLERLRATFDGGTGPFPERLIALAEALFRDLHASADPAGDVLLHGDLHHDNILAAGRAPWLANRRLVSLDWLANRRLVSLDWLAIDPKGLAGEPAYEVPAFLRNPSPWLFDQPDPAATTARRIAIFADELGFDRQRLHQWNVAQAVLSAVWTFEDHGHVPERFLAFTETLTTYVR